MTTRSSKAKALSLFSPLSRLFGSQRSSKSDTKAALDDSFTVVSLPQALSPPQRRGRSSSLGDLRPRPLNFPGRRETSPGSTLDLHPHNLLDIPAPQAVSPTEIEHVTSTSATLVDSPASGKSHSPINSGNSLSFSTVVHKIDADSEAQREEFDGLPRQIDHPAKGKPEGRTGRAVEAGVATFGNALPAIMDALDSVSSIHPAVKVLVIAFQGAYKLQCARTENDKRIKTLDLQVWDMLEDFSLLSDVRDPSDLARISSRVDEVARRAAEDIKGYSACTDLYLNQRLLLKVLMSPLWEQRLLQFVSDFAERRKEMADALSLCSARGISKLQQDVQLMEEKTNALMQFFKLNVPTEEAKMKNELDNLENGPGDLQQLIKWTPIEKGTSRKINSIITVANNLEGSGTGRKDKAPKYTMEYLLAELRVGFDESIRQHMDILLSKINLQDPTSNRSSRKENEKKQFMHERIVDPELSIIWKEMKWSRNVKASRFVSTLRDHYQETLQDKTGPEDSIVNQSIVADEWTLPYIDVKWLQPIVESFDEDGSGYVTISEINNFTQSRPSELGWSLRKWIAYWAIGNGSSCQIESNLPQLIRLIPLGWRINMTRYRQLAQLYLRDIYTTLPKLLPINRKLGETYFYDLWNQISGLVVSPPLWAIPDDLIDRFDDYVSLEENRMAENLVKLKFNIDAPSTVNMIVGSGVRIEKSVFSLLYLMLKQHSTLIQRGTVEVISRDEVLNASNSLTSIRTAVDVRVLQLTDNWDQQRLDSKARLDNFAWGIFRNLEPDSLTISKAKGMSYLTLPPSRDYENFYLTQSIWRKEVEDLWEKHEGSAHELPPCKPRFSSQTCLNVEAYTGPDTSIPENSRVSKDLSSLLGRWNGLSRVRTVGSSEGSDQESELRYTFLFREPSEFDVSSSSILTFGGSYTSHAGETYPLSGVATMEEDKSIKVTFVVKYPDSREEEYRGLKAEGSEAVAGSWKTSLNDPTPESIARSFVLVQVSEDVMELLTSPRVLVWNRARLLWHLAIDFAIQTTKQRTWRALHERRTQRKQFVELYAKAKRSWLLDDEYDILIGLYSSLSFADIQYYESLGDNLYNTIPEHPR